MESKKAEITEYLTSKMYGFLEPMLVDVMKNKPNNTVQYCISWLQKYQENRKNEDISDDQSDSVDDNSFNQKRKAVRNSHKRSRMGISEEVFGSFNKKSKFAPKTIEKAEESQILILSLIRNSILFQNINSADEQRIIDAMGQKDCCQGQTIIEEGGDGNQLYIVSSGEFDCFKNLNGKETYLKTYNYGESFGQLALMYNAPRAATIRVKTPGKLFTLDRQTFSSVVKEANIRRREMLQNVVSRIDIFAELDSFEKQQFYDILKQERVQTGQYIIKQGQKGDRFYIVIDGKFAAEKETGNEEKRVVYNYKQGDYFGQLSLIHDIDRQASVKALTAGRLVSIDRVAFMRILGSMKDILQRNAVRYEKYQCELVC